MHTVEDRWGKDDVALHWTACASQQRVGTYWHLLPEAAQARKAIFEAVNPRTGKRRIDEAFPFEIRNQPRETDMFIRFKNGSTWQVVGSDNYSSLVGSPPIGVVFSEWALADPRAWAFIRPILDENGGWAAFISTPRGRNHLYRTYQTAENDPEAFAQKLTAYDTPVFSNEQLKKIKEDYISDYGEDDGEALFNQEYLVSFEAPLVGSYYGSLLEKAEAEGRIVDDVPIEPGIPVQTAWDLGRSDDTVIWFFQTVANEFRILDFYANHGEDVDHYTGILRQKAEIRGWTYGEGSDQRHWVPWDAKPKSLAAKKSVMQQAWDDNVRLRVTPQLSVQDGIQAARKILPRCWFDKTRCEDGIDALRSYRRQWDSDKKAFKKDPVHDHASHASDGFRMLAVSYQPPPRPKAPPKPKPRSIDQATLNDLFGEADRLQDNSWRI